MRDRLLQPTPQGLYCAAGDFHIDPWASVPRAVVTHAHGDHARSGSASYLCAMGGGGVLRERIGAEAPVRELRFGETIRLGSATVSLHPAGHILGSAQVRIEHRGDVCVFSGDYKLAEDDTCVGFEPVKCRTFISESTFGLPIYRWRQPAEVHAEIDAWWRTNAEEGRTSVLFAYSLGKAQRVLARLNSEVGPILYHGSIARLLPHYEVAGVRLPAGEIATKEAVSKANGRAFVIAPPATEDSTWLRAMGAHETAAASGWMQLRGTRRRRNLDRGFVLSDHADWPGLLSAIAATGAEEVGVTHGYIAPMVRYLGERGLQAYGVPTRFTGEMAESEPEIPKPVIDVEEP